ncbi:MAG: ATP-dependent sacrificial sulfur transferase LarE [bacterium]
MPSNKDMKRKLEKLKRILKEMDTVVIAFSGGVDSSFLARVAADVLGAGNVVLCTALSETYPADEAARAAQLARTLGARHVTLHTREMDNPLFASNPPDRCYHCKSELFSRLENLRKRLGFKFVADGANADDDNDFRPGRAAAAMLNVRSPLAEARLTKAEIRAASRSLRLPTWNLPAAPCLSSRFPYRTPITTDALRKVENAEKFLINEGFKTVRVRHHGDVARVEVHPSEMKKFFSDGLREKVAAAFKSIGYHYAALDLLGYRHGSMNEVLSPGEMEISKNPAGISPRSATPGAPAPRRSGGKTSKKKCTTKN